MILNQNNTAIIIIDIQEKLLKAVFNKEQILENSKILSSSSKILNIPVIITEQYPKGLGETVSEIKTSVNNALYFEKTDFNALTDPVLLEKLKKLNKKQIVIFGVETHICVHQTAFALIQNDFDVVVAKDACGSRRQEEYISALEAMKSYNIKLKTTEMILFELIKTAKHPNFKEIQCLIK